jgi:benzylsuccinate CoA-transferase BbsF subunit
MPRLPLDGIRIIDSTTILAAPYSLALLGDFGADVIKVEAHTRQSRVPNMLFHNEVGEEYWNESGFFNIPNRSKRGITLDLKKPQGMDVLLKLVDVSDVFVENNRPGAGKRLGIDYESLRQRKPDLIMLSNSGFGQTGPWTYYGGIGRMLELTTGLASLTGYADTPPQRVGSAYVDLQVSYAIVLVLMAALIHRERTGEGQYIDLSMYQIGVSMVGDALLSYAANGDEGARRGNRDPWFAPQGVYPCQGADRWVALSVRSDSEWEALCAVTGMPEMAADPRFADGLSRLAHQDELDALIARWTQTRSAQDVMDCLQAHGIAAGKVNDGRDIFFDPQLIERGFFAPVTHPPPQRLGTRIYPGRPYHFQETPVAIQRPAPLLGEHNREVLGGLLGYPDDEIAALERDEVIGDRPIGGSAGRRTAEATPLDQQMETGHIRAVDPEFEERLAHTYAPAPAKRGR